MQSNSFSPPTGEAVRGVSFSSPSGMSGGAFGSQNPPLRGGQGGAITRAVRLYGKEDLRLEELLIHFKHQVASRPI